MIDFNDSQATLKLQQENYLLAKQYRNSRIEATRAKIRFEVILSSRLEEYRLKKPNMGEKMAILTLLGEGNKEANELYREYQEKEADYKGLERVIESLRGAVILNQSLIKNQNKNGG